MDMILLQRINRRQAGSSGGNTNILNAVLLEPLFKRWSQIDQQLFMRVRTAFYGVDNAAGGTTFTYSTKDQAGRLYMDDIEGLQIGENNAIAPGRLELTCPDTGFINITGITTAKITWNAAWGWMNSLAIANGNVLDSLECSIYLEILKPANYNKNNL